MHPKILLFAIIFIGMAAASARADTPPARYTVQADDSLPQLADKYYRDPLAWPAIYQANAASGVSPYAAPPGQVLTLPAPAQIESLRAEYLAAGHPPPEAAAIVPISARWLANFGAYIEDSRHHFGIPGVALAVVHNNQIALAQGLGVRQVGQPAPVTPETVFGIGSTTKTMNSLLIATLVDDHRLNWDDRVLELWPAFALSDADVAARLRLRNLLGMDSGLPRADLVWSGSGMTAEQVMQSLAGLPLPASPGEQFAYNNQAVATAGFVAALAAGGQWGQLGKFYPQLMQQRVFAPVGMAGATFDVAAVQANPNHATPHDFTLAGETVPTYFHTDPGIDPAGGINASLMDLARLVQTELARGVAPGGRRVVSEQNLTETWRPGVELYPGSNYAMGWFVENYHGVEMLWHDGDVLGFKSLLVLLPQANIGLVVLTNRNVSYGFANSTRYHFVESLFGLNADAGEYFRRQWTTFMATGLPQARAPLSPTITAEAASPWLGNYQNGWQVARHADGTLWATRGDYGWQLWATAQPGQFVVGNGFGLLTPLKFITATNAVTMSFELSTGETGAYRRLAN